MLVLFSYSNNGLGQVKSVIPDLSKKSSVPCGYDLKCLEKVFRQTFKHSEKELVAKYGQPDDIEYDPALGKTLTFSCFSVRIYQVKPSHEIYLSKVAIWDSSFMASYGFVKGMIRDSLENVIKMKPAIYNEQENYLELEYTTDAENGYHFNFAIRDNKLEGFDFRHYIDE
jgi:hypothetical protein